MAGDVGFAIKVGADIGGADNSLKTLGTNIAALDRSISGLTIDVKFNKVTDSIKQINRESKTVESTFGKIKRLAVAGALSGGSAAVGMLGMDALRGGLGGIGDIVADSVSAASEFEKTTTAFEVMLGSADKAKNLVDDLRGFAAESPFTFKDVTEGAQKLTQYGITAKQLVPTFRALGDVIPGDSDRFNRVLQNYGQVAIEKRLTGDSLRDFTNNNFPIIEPLAKVKGVDPSQIRGMAQAGQIDFRDTVMALKQMTSEGGKFFGMGERYANSFAGSIDRLSDSLETLKRDFGQILIEELDLKGGARDIAAFTDRVRASLQEVRPAVRLVGDLARAGTQVGFEFARAGAEIAGLGLRELANAIPGLSELPDKVGIVLRDLQDFRIDPAHVANAAKAIFTGIIVTVSAVEEALNDPKIRKGIEDNFIKPFEDMKKTIEDIRQGIIAVKKLTPGGILNAVNDAAVDIREDPAVKKALDQSGQPAPGNRDWASRVTDRVGDFEKRIDNWAANASAAKIVKDDPVAALMGGAMADIVKNPRPLGLEAPFGGDRNASGFELPPGLELGSSQAANAIAAAMGGISQSSPTKHLESIDGKMSDLIRENEQLRQELGKAKATPVVLPKG